MNNIATGKLGEAVACSFLEKQGYKILELNRHFSRYTEVDIIALDKKVLVFVEVKTRRNNYCGTPFEAITETKYQHLRKGLYIYLSENPQYKKFRIDAIGITLKPKLEIQHLKNI